VLGTEATLAVMDALGIQGLLFDEYQTTTEDGAPQPGYRLADGAFRPVGPNAEAAALRHPERFAFLMRVDLRDPGIEGWIETLAAAPGFKALRTLVFTPSEGAVFADGSRNRQTMRLIALLAHAESALRRDRQRHRIQRIPHTTAGLRTRQGDLESGGWLNSPVAANRTAEFGRDTAQSAADLRQVGTGTGSTEVCIPEVGRGLRVQVRHGGLLGCGGACHRSSLTSNGFHDEQVKPVRRM